MSKTSEMVDRALELAPRIAAMLHDLEWAGGALDDDGNGCPVCKGYMPGSGPSGDAEGHSDDCPLALLLREADEVFPPPIPPEVVRSTWAAMVAFTAHVRACLTCHGEPGDAPAKMCAMGKALFRAVAVGARSAIKEG